MRDGLRYDMNRVQKHSSYNYSNEAIGPDSANSLVYSLAIWHLATKQVYEDHFENNLYEIVEIYL